MAAAQSLPTPADTPQKRSCWLPVRGQAYSAIYTCPGCGVVQQVRQLQTRMAVSVCSNCSTIVRIGLSVQILPGGPFANQMVPSDYCLTKRQHSRLSSRLRTRKRRHRALEQLGLSDPFPLAVEMPWSPGAPINHVEVIEEPR